MILAMVRHGLATYNAKGLVQGRVNTPLTNEGRQQAKQLGQLLKQTNDHFDFIASSPLSRALETAYIISKQLDMNEPIYVDHQFVERDFGHLDGTPIESAMPLVRMKDYQHENYENDSQMIQRISKAISNLYQQFPEKKILFVAHSHVIKSVLMTIDSTLYSFADLIRHLDVIYFEVTDKKVSVINRKGLI